MTIHLRLSQQKLRSSAVMMMLYLLLACTVTTASAQLTARNFPLPDEGSKPAVQENRHTTSLENALRKLEKQFDIRITYKSDLVDNKFLVKEEVSSLLAMPKTNMEKSFHHLMKSSFDLNFKKYKDNYYILIHHDVSTRKLEKKPLENQKSITYPAKLERLYASRLDQPFQTMVQTISGRVTDLASGEPLPGVNVLAKGTTTGTVTDMDGQYRLTVADDITSLVFSFIGYTTEEVAIGGRSTIDVQLAPDVQSLQEVVVVGYGEQKKVNLTGAVSTLEFDKSLENRPLTNPSQALAGKVTGVWVSQNSGAPGSDGATLRVRGFGTLNDSNPLVLIDGVEGRLAELNPNDIASMTVLKDAASAAIYGSRAANGVVLVTTKGGNYESGTQLSYNGYYGLQQLGRRYDLIDNSAEYMDMWNTAVVNSGGDPLFPQEVIDGFRNGNDPYRYPNTNYFDEVFQTAPITEHNLSVRGGGESQSYYLSFNYLDQEGIIKNTSAQRYGINLNLNSKVNNWLELGGRFQGMRKITDRPYDDIGRAIYLMANGHPFSAPYTRDGRFGATQAVYLSGERAGEPIVDTRNPMPDVYNGQTQYTNNFLKAILDATVNITPDLKFKSLYSAQYNHNLQDRYNELISVYTDAGFETKTLDFPAVINLRRRNTDEFYWVFFNTLNFDKAFGEKHFVSAVAGMQSEERQIKYTTVQKSDPPKSGLHQVDAGTSNPIAEGNATQWRMMSYFGRVNYNFDERYLLEANLRADASSRFKQGNRWGIFPSFSAGWRLSEEPFMQQFDFLNNLKIRASWGRLGNQNIEDIAGNFPYLTVIAQNYGTSYNLGGQLVPGAAITSLVDENISWETSESTDIGFEVGVLNNRLNLEFDYFTRLTKDILVRLPIPQILGGVNAPVENVGEMRNNGVELAVSYLSDSYNKDWSYSIGANVSYVNNEVTKFRGGDSPDQLYLIREGVSYQSLYGFKAVGIYQSDQEAEEHMYDNAYVPEAGDIQYEDVNQDGKLNFEDKQVLGNTIPKFTYGLNFGVSYKGWNLDFVGQGVADVYAYTQNAWTAPLGISGGSVTTRWRDAWTEENRSTELPRIKVNDTWNRQESSFWMSNLSYFKIKNVQLTYNFPANWLERIGVGSAAAYLNVQNSFSIVSGDYEGFDPERNTFDSGYSPYPTPIITSLGINLQF